MKLKIAKQTQWAYSYQWLQMSPCRLSHWEWLGRIPGQKRWCLSRLPVTNQTKREFLRDIQSDTPEHSVTYVLSRADVQTYAALPVCKAASTSGKWNVCTAYFLLPVVIASNCKKTSLVSRLDARKFCFSNRVDAWNHLPDHVVNSTSLSSFKRRVSLTTVY